MEDDAPDQALPVQVKQPWEKVSSDLWIIPEVNVFAELVLSFNDRLKWIFLRFFAV